jgi:hypothetical protein
MIQDHHNSLADVEGMESVKRTWEAPHIILSSSVEQDTESSPGGGSDSAASKS